MSNEPKAGMNLDPEMLAAYIDKRLTPEERAAVEAQLANDPDSYAVLVETIKALDQVPEVRRVPQVPRVRWTIVAGVLAAAAAALALFVAQPEWLQRFRGERVDPRMARLVAAVGEERYIEARLTGGFKYGPLKSVNRSQQDLSNSNLSLVAAAGELQKAAAHNPDTATLHAWGVAQLLLGQLDGSIESLSAAASRSDDDKAVLSDLAAAYVARAAAMNRSEDWPRALTAANKAVEGTSNPIREALFNRALAAEALNLPSVAAQYWDAYLAVETQPEWRAEATSHLRKLRERAPQSWLSDKPAIFDAAARADESQLALAVSRHSQRIRETVEDELLPKWAAQESRGDADAAPTLSIASRLATALAAKTGDDLLSQSLHRIESFDGPTRLRVAAAVERYASGRAFYERAAMQDSVAPFAAAKRAFERDQVPLAEWCELYLATAAYYRGDYPSALSALHHGLERTAGQPWLALTARIYWLRGLIATQRAEYDHSLADYTRALQLFERLAEGENQAAVHSLLATALLYVGDEENVWLHTVRALQTISADSAYRRQHMILVGAANRATRLDLPEAALAFADEAAAVNLKWNDAIARVEIANYRARTLVQLGRFEDAKIEVDGARQSLDRVLDKGLRERAVAEVMQTEADVLATADPRAGIDAAGRAIEYFRKSRGVLRIPRLYATRAAARRRLGDLDGAVTDLREGASSFDSERQTLPRSERLRLSYSDEVWGTYRQLVAAEVARGASCEDVIAAAERARATTLLLPAGAVGGESSPSLGPADENVAVLSFSFVDDRLAIIVLRRGRCDLRLVDVSQMLARKEITALRSELSAAGAPPAPSPSESLFQRLIQPVWPLLEGTTEIDIIADGPLHYLPFAALRTSDGSRLVELMAIKMIPNLRSSEVPANTSRVALLSSGGVVRDASLPPLPGVKDEMSAVASSLAAARLTTRQVDTAQSFIEGLHDAGVVHFAGHAIVNEQYPLLSRLVLAGSDRDEWVTGERLSTIGMISPRLVFLSACATQAGRLFGGEGPASLARSFIAAGAHEVVASLWPVADGRTPEMVAAFYKYWLQSGDAASALRAAMVADLRAHKTASQQWAAWVVIGRAGHVGPRQFPNKLTGD